MHRRAGQDLRSGARVGEKGEERREGLFGRNAQGERVDDLDLVDRRHLAAVRRGKLVVEDALEGEFDVVRGARGAILKLDAPPQLDLERAVIGHLEALGEIGNDIHLGVEFDQPVIDRPDDVELGDEARFAGVALCPGEPRAREGTQRGCGGRATQKRAAADGERSFRA